MLYFIFYIYNRNNYDYKTVGRNDVVSGVRKRAWLAGLATVGLCLGACSNEATSQPAADSQGAGLDVVTSFYPTYAITREVSGDLNDVRMINSGAGIHGFEPSAEDVAAIADSDIFVYYSGILESWAGRLEDAVETDVRKVEASSTQELIAVEGLEEFDDASAKDPHSWLDPLMAAESARYIADELSEVDPEQADYYKQNAADFAEAAQALVDEYEPKFKELKHKTFVTQHTAFSYLAERFGLKQLGIAGIDGDVEPSPKQMAEIKAFMEERGVKTIFVEPNVSDKTAQTLAAETGAKVEMLSPLEYDPQNTDSYLDNLEAQLETLYQSLKAEES